jgi:hypothetical protein
VESRAATTHGAEAGLGTTRRRHGHRHMVKATVWHRGQEPVGLGLTPG